MGIHIALAGNPNCGKTTMFNKLTGSSQYVGNWPGVTVEKKQGKYTQNKDVVVTDLPGIYSLSPYSPEEIVSREYLMGGEPDVVVNLIDATNLERNLYLTTQILELGLPVVIALNMMDLVKKNGDKINVAKLSEELGCLIVETSGLKGEGMEDIVTAAIEAAEKAIAANPKHEFSPSTEGALSRVAALIEDAVPQNLLRWYSIKLLEGEERTLEALNLSGEVLGACEVIRVELEQEMDDDIESVITFERYDRIGALVAGAVKAGSKGLGTTQKIDRIVTNRWLGLPIFIIIMTLVYYISVSTVGTIVTGWANEGVFGDGWLYTNNADFSLFIPGIPVVFGEFLASIGTADWLNSLIIDGVIGGVGAILGFVPQMIVLFLLLSFLEDCGYMARVAFIMDRVFRKFGLSGKSFIPMLIASGCGVPAIMATKTIENEKDRRMTIMTTTMIPCGAKMPIIALVFGALAGGSAGASWWLAPLFYFIGLFAIIVSGIMLKKTKIFAGETTPFIMELPQYHLPVIKNLFIHMWERVRSFIVKAGTIIFLSSIVVWALLNLGFYEGSFGLLDPELPNYIQYSLMAGIGNAIAWVFAPLGFGNWQATVATITGLVAKENVVATLGVLFNLSEVGEGDASMWSAFAALLAASAPGILAFCAFNLLCAPCFAAIGTIHRQMGSAKWTWFAIGYMTLFAWCLGLMIYQFGGLITGELEFSVWSGLAFVILLGMLFQIFRPIPRYENHAELAKKLTANEHVL